MGVLLVGLDGPAEHLVGLRVVRSVEVGSFVVGIVDGDGSEDLGVVQELLSSGSLLGAAWLPEVPDDRLWMAFEWRGSLIIDRVMDWQPLLDQGWHMGDFHHAELVLLRPGRGDRLEDATVEVETEAEFADSIGSDRPTTMLVPVSDGLLGNRALFGDLADPRVGGAIALVVLAGGTNRPEVRLRNPAALGLRLEWGPTSMSHQQFAGAIGSRAMGSSLGSSVSFGGFRRPDDARAAWQAVTTRPRRGGPAYGVVLELEAFIDPEIIVPVGHVFQQTSVNGVQTLAAAGPAQVVVTPGRLEVIAVPAWCLNEHLRPPSGEPLQATPLRASYDQSTSQRDVWADRARWVA